MAALIRLRSPYLTWAIWVPVAAATMVLTAQTLGANQAPPQETSVFRTATNLVQIDVRVVDQEGRPVTDLTRADFTVTEDGRPQEIAAFATRSVLRASPDRATVPLRRASGYAPASPQTHRVFLLVLGRADMAQCVSGGGINCSFTEGVRDGLNALVRFVRDTIGPNDYVGVYGYNRLTDFTTDRQAILGILDRYVKENRRIETGLAMAEAGSRGIYGNGEPFAATQKLIDQVFASSPGLVVRRLAPLTRKEIAKLEERRRQMLDDMLLASLPGGDAFAGMRLKLLTDELPTTPSEPGTRSRSGVDGDLAATSLRGMRDLGSIYAGIEALRPLEGEKQLILMSPGGIAMLGEEGARDLGRAASDARVVLSVIHTGGVSSSSVAMSAQSRTLATLTGGTFDANRFPTAAMDLDRIDEDTSFAYLLGYELQEGSRQARFREIRVAVNRPDLRLSYRHGYFWPAEFSGETVRKTLKFTRVATAAEYAKEIDDISFAVSTTKAAPLTARFDLLIDPGRLSFETAPSGRLVASIEVAAFCLDSRQRPVGDGWKTVVLDLSEARRDDLQRAGRLAVQIEVPLTARADSAKIVVYDYGADVLGSKNVKVPK